MKYSINNSNYHMQSVIEIGKLPARSYFIPFSDRERADSVNVLSKRYSSDKVRVLNGLWDFAFYRNPNDVPAEIDTDEMSFDVIKVPGCLQMQGYDKPFYLNSRYPFPCHPPVIPTTEPVGKVFCWLGTDCGIGPHYARPDNEYNFVGIYRRYIRMEEVTKRYTISFLGVMSCIDVYVNGRYIGYSEGAHNTAEFDLTGVLETGDNELVCVIRRWSSASYLECQDMFRHNGIFRDVLLYESVDSDVRDFVFDTSYENGRYTATVDIETYADTDVKLTLAGRGERAGEINITKEAVTSQGRVRIVVDGLDVCEWSADRPELYDMYIETPGGCIKTAVGFKRVEIEGRLFRINGSLLKFHGVNHHDTSAVTGYTMSPELMLEDVKLCKEYNVDTVRTSHYPPDPIFLELCDEYGLYVVDEADLETHGCFNQKLPPMYEPNYNIISRDLSWREHYLDRAVRMYRRDVNHPSIFMWSLGNESGGYECQDVMYEYLKKVSNLPIHYEGAIHSKREAYDVGSEMYPSPEHIHNIGAGIADRKVKPKLYDRPYFMCEYAHAMGVGPGGIEDYWREIYEYESLMGGCIWEMVDHAILESDGRYTYGGDHGEYEHDGNFCVDGLFYPDRTPSTGAKLMRYTYRPIRVSHISGDEYEFFNTTGFRDGEDYELRFTWSDGSSAVVSPDVKPLEKCRMVIRHELPDTDDVDEAENDIAKAIFESDRADNFVNIVCIDKRTGQERSTEQLVLSEVFDTAPADRKPMTDLLSVDDDGRVRIRMRGGALESAEPNTILWRADTDNDEGFFADVKMKRFINAVTRVKSVSRDEYTVTVVSEISGRGFRARVTDVYENTINGILVTSTLHTVRGNRNYARFGKTYRLEEKFDDIYYYGRNGESYIDMRDHTQIEHVRCKVADMVEPYIRPQESGNRMDCRFVTVSDGESRVTFTAVDKAFELGVKPYSDVELKAMRHREDEVRTGTYVTISAFQAGIGSASCGPACAEECRYPMNRDYELRYMISLR